MSPVRCPKCDRLLGYFDGRGVVQCTRCRKGVEVEFDTTKDITRIRASRTP